MSTLRLRIKHANQQVQDLALDQVVVVKVESGATYSVINADTQEVATDVVLKRKGHSLIVERDDALVAEVQEYYSEAVAYFDVGAAGGEAGLISPASPVADGTSIVWQASGGAAAWMASHVELVGAAGLTVAVAASQDDGVSGPPNGEVEVLVTGGPVIDGNDLVATFYQADGVTEVGTGKIAADGTLTLSVGTYSGVVLVKVESADKDSPAADYIDETTGVAKDLADAVYWADGVIESVGGKAYLNINLLSTLAHFKAVEINGDLSEDTPLTAEVVNSTNTAVAEIFGIPEGEMHARSIITTVDASGQLQTTANAYGKALAVFSGMDPLTGSVQESIDALVNNIKVDRASGKAVVNPTFTATLTAAAQAVVDQFDPDGSLGANSLGLADFVTQVEETSQATGVTYTDEVGPHVTISLASKTLEAGAATTVTFKFNEAPVGFDANDIQATGGELSDFAGSGKLYTATFTASATESKASIEVTGSGFTDAAENAGFGAKQTANILPSGEVEVLVVGGPVIDGNDLVATFYAANGSKVVGTGKIAADGTLTLNVGTYSGVVMVKVESRDKTSAAPDYIDETTGEAKDLADATYWADGVIENVGGKAYMNINILSTIAHFKSLELNGELSATNPLSAEIVNSTNQAVAQAFGVPDGAMHAKDAIITTVDADGQLQASANAYGKALAVFSGMDSLNAGGSVQESIDALVNGINVQGGKVVLQAALTETLSSAAEAVVSALDPNGDLGLAEFVAQVDAASQASGGDTAGSDTTGGDTTGGDSTGGDSTGGDSTGGDAAVGDLRVYAFGGDVLAANDIVATVYEADGTTAIGELAVGEDGLATFDLDGYSGAVIIKIGSNIQNSSDSPDDYLTYSGDEANLGSTTNDSLYALAVVDSGAGNVVNVSRLSDLVYRYALARSFVEPGGDPIDAQSVESLNAGVAGVFGVDDISDTSSDAYQSAATMLAALAEAPAASISEVVNAMYISNGVAKLQSSAFDSINSYAPELSDDVAAVQATSDAATYTLGVTVTSDTEGVADGPVTLTLTFTSAVNSTELYSALSISGATFGYPMPVSGSYDKQYTLEVTPETGDGSFELSIAANALNTMVNGQYPATNAAATFTQSYSVVAIPAVEYVTYDWDSTLTAADAAADGEITVVAFDATGLTATVTLNGKTYTTTFEPGSFEAKVTVPAEDLQALTGGAPQTITATLEGSEVTKTAEFAVDFVAPEITGMSWNWGDVLNDAEASAGLVGGWPARFVEVATTGAPGGEVRLTLNGNSDYSASSVDGVAKVYVPAGALTALTDGDTYTMSAVYTYDGKTSATFTSSSSFAVDFTAPTISSITADWGAVLSASEEASAGSVTIVTDGAEDDQTLTLTLISRSGIEVGIYTGTVAGNSVTVAVPAADLQGMSAESNGSAIEYELHVEVSDAAGNTTTTEGNGTYATMVAGTRFTVDRSVPTLESFTPADDAASVAVGSDLTLTFSKAVTAVDGGIITLKDLTGSSDVVIDVDDATQVTVTDAVVTINPTSDLLNTNDYAIQISDGAFVDDLGNAYAGVADDTTFNFTTEASFSGNSDVVVFDLVNGASSDHSNRTFVDGTSYTIYLVVDSDANALNASTPKWAGASNLGSDDKLILVGDGSAVLGRIGNAVSHFSYSGSKFIWQSDTGRGSPPAVWANNNGNIYRMKAGTATLDIWDGTWGGYINAWNNFDRNAITPYYQTSLSTAIMSSQGLVAPA